METYYIDPDKVNKKQTFSFDDLILVLSNIHMDLQDIQSTMVEQNNLLDELVHPHKALFDEENYCLCEFKKEESNKPCEM